MNPAELDGCQLALLLMAKTEDNEDDWAIIRGTLSFDGNTVFLNRGKQKEPFPLREEWLERITPVSADVKDIMNNAEYYIPLSMGNIDDAEAPETLEHTGLQWPD